MGMAFLRNGTDHHTLAFAKAPADAALPSSKEFVTFNHLALEVDSVEDLFKAREFLKEQGVEITFEGRRGAGCNVGIEFKDPDGYSVELTCQMDQVPWDGEARPHDQHRRASSLEEAVANPVAGAEPVAAGR
jgi:catechol-2,3-dioxygenase